MNTSTPTASQINEMRLFLARVIRTPLAGIQITEAPTSDQNADILKSVTVEDHDDIRTITTEKLCPISAIEIDSILAGELHALPDGLPDIQRGAAMFSQFVAQRANLYP